MDGRRHGTVSNRYPLLTDPNQAHLFLLQGTMLYENGDVYEGEWKDGKRDGTGIYVAHNKTEVYWSVPSALRKTALFQQPDARQQTTQHLSDAAD